MITYYFQVFTYQVVYSFLNIKGMNYNCPNSECISYQLSTTIVKDGSFKRKDDSRIIQRFKCKNCLKRFSASTSKLEYRQKKRRVNYKLYKLLASGISLRRSALLLGIHRETARKKLRYLGEKSRLKNKLFLKNLYRSKVRHLQFDDLITKENSKLKPLAVSIAVDAERRFVLGAEVSQIPSFGHLAKVSKAKYGPRKCFHRHGLFKLFNKIHIAVEGNAQIRSDEHKKYPELVGKFFPGSEYERFKSERAHVAGQGELKKVLFDPLFAINHTCAMFRANINRLVRKTWCTTKDRKRLQDHLDLFICFYNEMLIQKNSYG